MDRAKPFDISKQVVWGAYQRVRANRGAAGVDGQSLGMFEKDLKSQLYKVWNRMSSGSYFPSPVRLVEIPKGKGGKRPLGIPTVADRVAQTVARMYLEPEVERRFHEDSYGARPGRSAHDAVGVARRRCWRRDWVIDLDIRNFFGSLDHDLLSGGFVPRCSGKTEVAWSAHGAFLREARSARCWRTSSCTMRSMNGCGGSTRTSSSSAIWTTWSSTVRRKRRPGRFSMRSKAGSGSAVSCFIRWWRRHSGRRLHAQVGPCG